MLIDALLSCTCGDEHRPLTLPQVLEALGADRVEGFPGLQAFQEHGWYAFLVQLAAMALEEAGLEDPAQSADVWHGALLALSGGDEAAWALVRDDLSAPSFLQPPLPEGSLAAWKRSVDTPDQLDLPITSKNHDLKAARAVDASPEQWVYALVDLQTLQGFSGRGNYGIARMNGGFGNRPLVTLVPSMRLGVRFKRDVSLLLEHGRETADRYGFTEGGHRLLWLEPWDGTASLNFGQLHPWFIEVSRRVRLTREGAGLRAWLSPSQAYRVDAKDNNGDLGDPWTPVHKAEKKGLTLGGRGFDYRLVHDLLLSGSYVDPLAMPRDADARLLYCAALVRGQGVTEGFHERLVPIPKKARWTMFGDGPGRDALAEMSQRRIQSVATLTRFVLRPALLALLNAGETRSGRGDERPERWIRAFEASVDDDFFQRLWADAEAGDADAAQEAWERLLYERGRAQLEAAIRAAPLPEARRYRAVAAAESVFAGTFRKQFPSSTGAVHHDDKR